MLPREHAKVCGLQHYQMGSAGASCYAHEGEHYQMGSACEHAHLCKHYQMGSAHQQQVSGKEFLG